MKSLIIITLTIIATLLLFTPDLLAQPMFPQSPDQAPIDGGLIWLLVGGLVYGIKKIRDQSSA